MRPLFTALLCLGLSMPLLAGAAPDAASAPQMTAEQFLAGLHFKQGKITLPGNIATLDLPPNFQYLDPADAGKLLVDGWGNPPAPPTLGMILPAGVNPLSAAGWGVIVTYDKDGHVKDDDADKINYAETEFTAELFKSLAGKHSLMVVEHDMGFVGSIADHVTVLHQGSVLAEGSLEQVQADERVIEVYLGR